MLKTFIFFIVLSMTIVGGSLIYFWYTMTIGDTWGLLEKLKQVDGVKSVEGYETYEGNAFFSLLLSNGGTLTLGGIGNTDLIQSDGIIIRKIGYNKIFCRKNSGGFSVGVSAREVQFQYLNNHTLNNVSQLIKSYDALNELFTGMPLSFKDSKKMDGLLNKDKWVCESNRYGSSQELVGKP